MGNMPWQLRKGLEERKRRSRKYQRPIAELLKHIDINVIVRFRAFPNNWHSSNILYLGFRYPFATQFKLSLANIEVTHKTGYSQIIALKWIRTGFGGNCRPRPVFICKCGQPVRKLYVYGGSLLCFHCCNAVNASQ